MQIIDMALLAVLFWSAWKGYKRGLVVELVYSFGMILALAVSLLMLDNATDWAKPFIGKAVGGLLPYIVFFCLIFIGLWVVRKLAWQARGVLQGSLLGGFDSLAGAVVSMLKIVFAISTLLWVAGLIGIKIPYTYTKGTFIYPVVLQIGPRAIHLFSSFSPLVSDGIAHFKQWLKH